MSGRYTQSQYIGAGEVSQLIGKWQSIVGGQRHDILGADVQLRPQVQPPQYPYGRPGYGRPGYPNYGHPGYPPNYGYGHNRPWWNQAWHPAHQIPAHPAASCPNPWARHGYPATSVRDHRRAALHQASVRGDYTAIGALALMGAEDAAAAQTGVPPVDATIPAAPIPAEAAPPLAPPPAPPGAPMDPAMTPPPVVQAPPAPVVTPAVTPAVMPQAPVAPIAQDPTDHPSHPEHHRRHHRHGRGGGCQCRVPGFAPGGFMMMPPQMTVPYAIPPRNVMVDRPGPSRADRILLPMSSGVNILPNTSAQITSRPQNVAFRPERIIIGGTPGDWIINDIKVGNRSQFSQSGDVPGETFASTAIDSFVSFETVQTAMDFVMLVTFVGTSETGAPFVCSVLGTAAV